MPMENIRIRTATVDEVPAPFISFPDLNLDLQVKKHPKPYGFGCFVILSISPAASCATHSAHPRSPPAYPEAWSCCERHLRWSW